MRNRITRLPAGKALLAGFGLAMLIPAITGAISVGNALRVQQMSRQVASTTNVTYELNRTMRAMEDAEALARDYLISGEASYREEYRVAASGVSESLKHLEATVPPDSSERLQLVQLESDIAGRLQALDLALGEQGEQPGPARRLAALRAQGGQMEAIRRRVGQMESAEQEFVTAASAEAQATIQRTIITLFLRSALVVFLLAALYGLIRRYLNTRERAAQALRESEERFRRLSDATLEGVTIHEGGTIIDANQTVAAMFGYTASELVGMSIFDLTEPGAREGALRNIEAGLEMPYESVGLRKDGSSFPVEVCARSMPYHGRMVRVSTLRDITERKRTEEALQEIEQRYSSVIASLEEGIVLQRADGSIMAINGSAERILGIPIGQMLELKSFYTRLKAIREDGAAFTQDENPTAVTLRTGAPCSHVVAGIRRPDGSLAWLSVNSQPLTRPGETRPYAVVTSFADITGRRQAEEALREMAVRDPLTGLYNRRELTRILEQEARLFRRYGRPCSLLMLDIDRFKEVNDRYGHQVGDEALQWLAKQIGKGLRDADRPARYGGEEFAVVLPDTSGAEAVLAGERLRRAIARRPFVTTPPDGEPIVLGVTVSVGVAELTDADGSDQALLSAADQALYEAKRRGRNAVVASWEAEAVRA